MRLVAAADADPDWGAALLGSLARGGEAPWCAASPAARPPRVRAKTGYLDGVSSLAGRVISRRGQRYAFAMLMNTADIGGARATQDRVVNLLASGAEDVVAARGTARARVRCRARRSRRRRAPPPGVWPSLTGVPDP